MENALKQEDYPTAINLCFKCQQDAEKFAKFQSVRSMVTKFNVSKIWVDISFFFFFLFLKIKKRKEKKKKIKRKKEEKKDPRTGKKNKRSKKQEMKF